MSNSVKKHLVNGVFYTALAKYIGIAVMIIISAVLARLLPPEDFGIITISTVFITFFNILSNLGIGPAIIQNQKLNKDDLSNIFSFTIYIGIIIGLLFFGLSWPISSYYNKDILINIFQLLSINIFFASANIVPNSLLLKEKRFKFIAFRTLIIQVVSGGIAIISAFLGLGIYALVIQPIFANMSIFIVSYMIKPQKFKWNFEFASIKLILSFSSYQFLFNFINYFSRNLDKLLIGRFINLTQLGYYDISYRLMMLPLQNITHVITPVMHPVFADYQNDRESISRYYLKITHLLAFIGFPLSVLLFFCAKEMILIVFGNQWLEAIPVFKILTLSVGIQVIMSTSGSIFQAANNTKILFISGLIAASINISGLLLALLLFKTLAAVAWALVFTFLLNFLLNYWIMFKFVFKKSLTFFFKELVSPILITILIALFFYLICPFIDNFSIIVALIIKIVFFIIILSSYIQIRKEYNLISLLNIFYKKIKK